jgi:CubicO group peptidase (beta-lactamase class C family)
MKNCIAPLPSPRRWTAWLSLTLFLVLMAVQAAVPFKEDKLREMDAVIEKAIAEKKCPGGVLWLEHDGTVYRKVYGRRAVEPSAEAMTEDTIFDLASLTKVCATTPALMLLLERGQVKLDEPVKTYLSEFARKGKDQVTIRHLMTHTSGLPPGIGGSGWSGQKGAIATACDCSLRNPPGKTFVYSDINFFVLGEVIQRVTGRKLEEFTRNEIYLPLQMQETSYLPPAAWLRRIAPTQPDEQGKMLRGAVHDPTARRMGGVAGHAGLFSTAADLARYARLYLGNGEVNGTRLFQPDTVRLATTVQSPEGGSARRGLGWDIDSPYAGPRGDRFPIGSYGHTGWTGTSLWIDPFSRTILIFLCNRNHPNGDGNVVGLRRQLGTLAAEAITDFDFTNVPGALKALPKSP